MKEYIINKEENTKIILSAPHAVGVTSERGYHKCDIYTGEIVYSLSKSLKITSIIMLNDIGYDANYTIDCAYKKELEALVKENNTILLLDFHKSRQDRPYDINVGTNDGKNLNNRNYLLNLLIKEFTESGYDTKVDCIFKAGDRTLSCEMANKTNVTSLQLEINSNVLKDSNTYIKLFDTICRFIRQVII